jgi:hypothetical protein
MVKLVKPSALGNQGWNKLDENFQTFFMKIVKPAQTPHAFFAYKLKLNRK